MISDPTDFAEEDNTASFDIQSFGLYRMSLLHVQTMSKMPVLFFAVTKCVNTITRGQKKLVIYSLLFFTNFEEIIHQSARN